MNRTFMIIVLILAGTFIERNAFPQYYVKSGKDSLGFEIDTAVLSIDEIPGTIDWQVSKDTITWRSLNNGNDTLWVRIDSTAYYRAVTAEGTCYPVNSSAALVGFRSIQVTGNNIAIDSAGGVYSSSNGVKIIVPPGATNENVTVSFELLDSISAAVKLPLDVFVGKAFCIGLYCEPELIHFLKPVRIIVPASKYSYTDLPFIYLYNSSSGLWNQYYGPMTCSEEEHFIEFTSQDLSPARIELIRNAFSSTKSLEGKGITEHEICQRGLVGILNKSHDQIGSFKGTDCQVVSNYIEAEFKECAGKPVSKDYVHEISENCIPVVKLIGIDKTCLPNKGDEAKLTFKMSIGGLPLEKNTITVLLPPGIYRAKDGAESFDLPTDVDGLAEVTIKSAADNVAGTIRWKAYPHYFLRVIEASGPSGTESHKEYEKLVDPPLEGSQKIECPVTYIYLEQPDNFQKDVGDPYTLKAFCSGCPDLEYFIHSEYGNSGVATVDRKTGVVALLKPGVVYFYAKSAGIISNTIGLSVSYQGTLILSKKINWNNYNSGWCCPKDDKKNCWIMTYDGTLHFKFYLNIIKDKRAFAWLDNGCESIDYFITKPSKCKDTTIYKVMRSEYYVTDIITSDIVDGGGSFWLDINYDYWPGAGCKQIPGTTPLLNQIHLIGSFTSGVINISNIRYIPEGCVAQVYGTCQLK